jgi:hypothetical protein
VCTEIDDRTTAAARSRSRNYFRRRIEQVGSYSDTEMAALSSNYVVLVSP